MNVLCLGNVCCFVNVFLCVLYFVHTYSLEELKLINYEVDIAGTPVKKEEGNLHAVYMTSQNGQKFQCILPQLNEETLEKEGDTEDFNVLELLKPMQSASCLSKSKGWWTYEFCFGRYIKQFHLEDGEIIGEVLTLGLYELDMDWNNETSTQERFKNAKQKYHSQYYTNGTKCDITGQPRNTEVRIYCEEDAFDYIYRVDEPGTCSYVITVHTSRLCSHPMLKPLLSNKAHTIKCHPVLNEEKYSIYLKKLEEEKALAEEKRSQWLSTQQERLQVLKKEILPDEDNAESSSSDSSTVPNLNSLKESKKVVKEFLIEEFKKEMERLQTVHPPETFGSLKTELEKQFDAILDETKQLHTYSDLNQESQAALASLLKVLLTKLDEAKGDVAKSLKLIKARSFIASSLKTQSADQSKTAVLDADKLQVRIHRFDIKSSDRNAKRNFEQQKKLEQTVTEKLEKAGLDAGGKKIELKIVTAYYDNEDGKDFQSLTEEETDQFQRIILTILTDQHEVVHEMKRHKKLEEGYAFTWDDNEETDNKED